MIRFFLGENNSVQKMVRQKLNGVRNEKTAVHNIKPVLFFLMAFCGVQTSLTLRHRLLNV